MQRVHEALADDERFRALTQRLPIGVYELDAAGRVTYLSERCAEISGLAFDETLTARWPEAVHPGDRARVLAAFTDREARGVPTVFRLVRGDGRVVWVRSELTALCGADGAVKGYLGVLVDVSESKHTEEALRASEYRYRQFVEAAAEGIWVIDAAGLTTFTNPRMGEMLGWTPDEMLGRSLFDFMSEAGRATALANIERRKRGIAEEHDFQFMHRSGAPVWTSISTRPLFEGETYVGALAMVSDVGVRRSAEEKIRQLNEDLAHRNRELERSNRELESFSYSVSHDLRAPLRAIDGFSAALERDYGDRLDEGARAYLARVRRASRTMAALVDDLLQLARVTQAELRVQRVDLSALAAEIVANLRAASPEREVDVVIARGLAVRGDGVLLAMLLSNLLDNAWKYTARRARARIEVGETRDGDDRVVFVRDDGAGYDPRYAGRLFQPFQRLHAERDFAGTGVGLATAARIVERHGGRIWGTGEPDRGATFSFVLPQREG